MAEYQQEYDEYKNMLEQGIENILKSYKGQIPKVLYEAMAYSLQSGGKRIRGVLLLSVCNMLGVPLQKALNYAVAVEMIHASSLIHDDLPCMDDDDMRRGKPSNHVVFGEANALYAGVGLLNFAYEFILARAESSQDIRAIAALATAAGVTGIVKGQSLDILYEGKEIDFETLKTIHECKTGSLIKVCMEIPTVLSNSDSATSQALSEFGDRIGVAFQIVDDVLDVTSTSNELGKTAGKDEEADKLTYVKVFGVDKARQMAESEIDSAITCLKSINYDSGFLEDTAKLILNRRN